jgi:hypothetical protein
MATRQRPIVLNFRLSADSLVGKRLSSTTFPS